jgi:hypothetical protein
VAKAAAANLLRIDKVRADHRVEANVAYTTDTGLLAKAVGKIARTVEWVKAAGGASRTTTRDRRRAAGCRRTRVPRIARAGGGDGLSLSLSMSCRHRSPQMPGMTDSHWLSFGPLAAQVV